MSIFKLIKEDILQPMKKDPAIKNSFEVLFNYPGVWALINYRVSHYIYNKGFKLIARAIMGLNQIITNIDIHPACKIGRKVFLDHAFGVVIGETAIVEDDVLIYQGVTLGGVSLDRDKKRHPTIKTGAVIGAGAKILGDIEIGENSRIGSNSVVVKSVPKNSTAVGIPARVIEKGRDTSPLSHNKIPDINKELFIYLFKRIEVLESVIAKEDITILEKDHELEAIYEQFLKSVKE